jgi:N-methylhydantoinase B
LAARRITGLLDRYGLSKVRQALQSNIEYSERRVRAEISSWPNGTHLAQTFVDHDYAGGKDIQIVCRATVEGSNLTLDFTGTAPQVAGFINSPIANTLSFVFLAVAGCCDPDIPINEGFMGPVKVILPEGSLVHPRRPAPVANCTCVSGAEIAEVVLLAIGGLAPERVGVNCHKNPLAFSFGHFPDGRMWVQLNFLGFTGGAGAAFGTDGWGLYAPLMTGVTTPSIEMTEIQYPSRIRKHEYISDTTGPGRWRGAPGLETIVEHLSDTHNSVLMDGVRNTSRGYAGGGDGGANRVLLRGANQVTEIPEAAFQFPLPPLGRLETIRGGGGGWGNALERPIEEVVADVLDGYVTTEGASKDYGVVLNGDGTADAEATETLRSQRSA